MRTIAQILKDNKTIAVVGTADLARAAGVDVVMDHCIKIEHAALAREPH